MLKKNALAVQELAKEFMGLNIGDKVETVKDYSKTLGLSVGTISKAIKEIEIGGGVELEKKGHLGTFLVLQDYKKLWNLSGLKNIICVMPLPYLKRYEGLASGIKKSMGDSLYFAYMRGAGTRIKFLESDNYHCAILSKLAAKEYIKENRNIKIAFEFGEKTYMGEHVIVHRGEEIKKIGIDRNSKDHEILTKINFQKNEDCEFVDINYSEIMSLLKEKKIDAAIWNLDNLNEAKLDVPYIKIKDDDYTKLLGEAVIVVKKENTWLENYLKKVLNRKNIIIHQNEVIEGNVIPTY